MENQSPSHESELEAAVEQIADDAVVEDFADGDIGNANAIEARTVELDDGTKRRVYVRKLTGAKTITALRTLGKFSETEPLGGSVYKLKNCLVKAADSDAPRFTDATALALIETCPASVLNSFLVAIHSVNPILKNA